MMQRWSALYRHRALAEILVGRELKARYRGTVLGFLWSFANPLLMMSIYVLVFRYYMRIDLPNYPAFVMCGLLPWVGFSSGVLEGMNSIVANGGIIKKVQLPVAVFPFVAVMSNTVHFVLSLPVLVGLMWVMHIPVTWHVTALPVLIVLQFTFTLAVAMALASWAVQFRDLVHVVPSLILVFFYLTPVFYTVDLVPAHLQRYVYLNPLTWLFESYRDIFYHHRWPSPGLLAGFALLSTVMLVASGWLFNKRRDMYPELV